MEDVLDIYEMPYNLNKPVICMDEKPYQLLDNVIAPLQMRPGDDAKIDSEYKREGTCSIFIFTEPMAGWCHCNVRERRTALDWAEEIKHLLTACYPDTEKIVLVMDNLNTHAVSSLYKRFPPSEARDYARRLEIHYTPKHGSWLNIAEIELNVMTRQCLSRRLNSIPKIKQELASWEALRNEETGKVSWHFTSSNAREKLLTLYPKVYIS
jgi:hypothetical protein